MYEVAILGNEPMFKLTFFMNHLCLSNQYVLYIGSSFDTILHRHHAAQVCIGLNNTFQLIDKNGLSETFDAVVIAANAAHRLVAPDTIIATLFLDIRSNPYQTISKQYGLCEDRPFKSLSFSKELISELGNIQFKGIFKESAKKIIEELIIPSSSNIRIDPRVREVLQQLSTRIDSQIPISELAQSVHISPSRLAHLFKEEVGTPIRRYSLWCRIRIAMEFAVKRHSLTDGAHHGGFTDSAHFSKVFKQMYGISPSKIVNKQLPVSVIFQ
ncbi:helix-turn-helix domain-containing protein [Colwellia sp. MSW7]|uniref:Helix-turn-helix domain-containing protein n=1 Tax=Colwellia maritima TaxID=2912588 RepID=A0ABS9X1R8_9GAMM|nr:helix-turn-helix domain-containing protein [Colwellia maritima]MCI2283737.1 helix-turn-helix domain-containing protein [Colwellia maritima]